LYLSGEFSRMCMRKEARGKDYYKEADYGNGRGTCLQFEKQMRKTQDSGESIKTANDKGTKNTEGHYEDGT